MQHPGAIVLLDEAPDDVSRLFRRLEKGGVDHVGVAALDDEPALTARGKSPVEGAAGSCGRSARSEEDGDPGDLIRRTTKPTTANVCRPMSYAPHDFGIRRRSNAIRLGIAAAGCGASLIRD